MTTTTLNQLLAQEKLPLSVEYNQQDNQFILSNWNTHNLYIDNKLVIEGGIVEISYTQTDEEGYPASNEILQANDPIAKPVANTLVYLLKESFKIKPKILSYISANLEDYLMGYNIEQSDIDDMKKSLAKYIALEGISLHHEESNGFVHASYLFSNRWDYLATTCLDVYCFKDTPKDMAQCGMVWE